MVAVCLCQSACSEVLRRPAAGGASAEPWWEASGNLADARDVQKDSTSAPTGEDALALQASAAAAGDSAVSVAAAPHAVDIKHIGDADRPRVTDEAERRRLAADAARRTAAQRESAKQVNEYVLWAIRNEMWKEARLHLERAVVEDSLASSLYNNLGLVYERLGLPARAEQAYERATVLNPRRQAYGVNLRRLQDRLEEAARFEPDRMDSLKRELDDLGFEPEVPYESRQKAMQIIPPRTAE